MQDPLAVMIMNLPPGGHSMKCSMIVHICNSLRFTETRTTGGKTGGGEKKSIVAQSCADSAVAGYIAPK